MCGTNYFIKALSPLFFVVQWLTLVKAKQQHTQTHKKPTSSGCQANAKML